MSPIGPQAAYGYTFASRAKRVHVWVDLAGVQHTAYLCEQHLYVDTGGALQDITPTGGIAPPPAPTAGGYGDYLYSYDTYGTPRPVTTAVALDKVPNAFSLANFGAILLAMTSPDGRLLFWDPAVGGLATEVVATAGTTPRGRLFVVTQERFVQVMGAVDPTNGGSFRRFAWCDQEDYTNWDYTNVTTQSGFLDIEPSSPIVTALATRTGTLIWTAKKALRSRFLGLPYVFNYEELSDACTPWSPQSALSTTALAVWMSEQGPFSYDGTSILPVACKIRPWIDDDIDLLQTREQSCSIHVADFNEFWWFYPQSGQTKNTRVGIYNYKEGWWSQGQMSRTAGITASYTSHTIMVDDTVAYQHESGTTYGGADLPWAETFDLNLASGAVLTTIKQLLPDIEGAAGNVRYVFFYRNPRAVQIDASGNVISPEQQTPPLTIRPDGYLDVRVTGRDVRMRINLATSAHDGGSGQVAPVTVGQHLIDAVPRGDR